MKIRAKHIVYGFLAAGMMVLVPLSFDDARGVTATEVCAEEGCCKNPDGLCNIGEIGPVTGYEARSWVQIIFGCG
jgi:hypothetical protein